MVLKITSLSNHQQTTECKVDAIRDLAQEETIRNLVWQVQMTISAFLHANLLKIPISRHADSSWREFISNFWQALGQPSDYISGPCSHRGGKVGKTCCWRLEKYRKMMGNGNAYCNVSVCSDLIRLHSSHRRWKLQINWTSARHMPSRCCHGRKAMRFGTGQLRGRSTSIGREAHCDIGQMMAQLEMSIAT